MSGVRAGCCVMANSSTAALTCRNITKASTCAVDIDCLYWCADAASPHRRDRLTMAHSTELLKGTLGLLILRTLELEPRHGVAIADRIEQITKGTFTVKAGSLFPALHRLEQE